MTAIPHSQLAPLPTQVPFRIVSKTIGSGAYACIKRAAPIEHAEPIFAVKFINKRYALKYGRIKQKQLQMEASLHKHIGLHHNIIEFYDTGEDQEWKWIAMELADGGDLFDKIESDSGVVEDIAHVYFTQLVNAVGYMHSKGVAHRDIKPENILLSADGDMKIADFGMAVLFEYAGKRKEAVTLCGSPPYVAPEVVTCGSTGGVKGTGYAPDCADIWSIGVVLFVLLAGNTPWAKPVEGLDEYGNPNEFSEYLRTNGHPKDELWEGLPLEVLSLLRGMMKLDVKSRFTLADVRRHPWFTRQNKEMDEKGRLRDPIKTATALFENLRVSPKLKSSKRDCSGMDVDSKGLIPSLTQPQTPIADMLFDWERPAHNTVVSSTQPTSNGAVSYTMSNLPSTQAILGNTAHWLSDEPTLSQFAPNASVPLSRTQLARRFRDILPASSLTKFYSTWTLNLLVPLVAEALTRLGVPTPATRNYSAQDTDCIIKAKCLDSRGCGLSGVVEIHVVTQDPGGVLVEVVFVKGSGDPLEWRRLFKSVAVKCWDAVYRPEE